MSISTITDEPLRYVKGYQGVTSTVTVSNMNGGRLIGFGGGQPLRHAAAYDRAKSGIIWATSNTTTPMMDLAGTGYVVDGISFLGDDYSGAGGYDGYTLYGGNPTAGIEVSYDAGLGPGKHIIDNCSFFQMARGLKAGDYAETNSSCDNVTVRDCKFYNCDVGLETNHAQAMDWDFFHPIFTPVGTPPSSPVCFQLRGAGIIKIYGGLVEIAGDIFNLDNTNNNIGQNNAAAEIYGMKIDSNCGADIKIVNSQPNGNDFFGGFDLKVHDIVLPSLVGGSHVSNGKHFAHIAGGMTLHLIGCKFMSDLTSAFTFDDTDSGSQIDRVIIERCRFHTLTAGANLFDTANSTGSCWLDFVRNQDYYGNRLTDVEDTEITST